MASRVPATPGMLAASQNAAAAQAEAQASQEAGATEPAERQGPFKRLLGMAKGDEPSDAATQAALGAEGLKPPEPRKIIMGSVMRGAIAGASLLFSANKFMPGMLGKIIGFIPLIPKVTFPIGALAALGAGAAVGALFGFIGGTKKAKKAVAKYAETQMQASQAAGIDPATGQPTGEQPVVLGPDGKPLPGQPLGPDGKPLPGQAMEPDGQTPLPPGQPGSDAAVKKNPVMGSDFASQGQRRSKKKRKSPAKASADASHRDCEKHGATTASARAARSGKTVAVKRGDTLGALARRHDTTVAAFMKANPRITNANLIYAGDTLHVPKAA